MPAFEICYLEDDGSLGCAFSVRLDSEMRAKILAHALKPADCHTLEVWRGTDLVYRRPESAMDDSAVLPHRPSYGDGRRASLA